MEIVTSRAKTKEITIKIQSRNQMNENDIQKISILKKKVEKRRERNKRDMKHIENKQQNGRHKSNKIKKSYKCYWIK